MQDNKMAGMLSDKITNQGQQLILDKNHVLGILSSQKKDLASFGI